MYYDRVLSDDFASILSQNGSLNWLYEFVKKTSCLDFQIGRNINNEWISVYRGLQRIITIRPNRDGRIKIESSPKVMQLKKELFGIKEIDFSFEEALKVLLSQISENKDFKRYYNNKKEGFYQNEFSRRYGILGSKEDDFVVVDKEAVIGYRDNTEKEEYFGTVQKKYRKLLRQISKQDSKRFGKDLDKKALGNELDFLMVNKNGQILLVEFKDGKNTSGIYLSPIQIGLYHELFNQFSASKLKQAVHNMIEQKQKLGLINPEWPIPELKEIVPVIVIADLNRRSSAGEKFEEVLNFIGGQIDWSIKESLQVFNYIPDNSFDLLNYELQDS